MSFQPDRFTALADACVLASALKCNFVLSLARADYFRLRWSNEIMDEVERTVAKLIKRKQDCPAEDAKAKASKKRADMEAAFNDACVENFEDLKAGLVGVNEKDRHVLAAAIQTSASVTVTDNLKDFPRGYCAKFDIEPQSTDVFVANVIALHPVATMSTIKAMRERLKRPEYTPEKLIALSEKEAMMETASLLDKYRLAL